MFRFAAIMLMAFSADAAYNKFSMLMGRFNDFPVTEFSARVQLAVEQRRLQDDTFCAIFEGEIATLDDDVIGEIECECTESATSFAIDCIKEDLCIMHTTGDMTSFTGDMSLSFSGDFSDPDNIALSDSLCFKYDEGTEACLQDSFVSDNCTVTEAGVPCESCEICYPDEGLVSFTCGSVSGDECVGDSLEGTPLQFYGSDTEICPADTTTVVTTDTTDGPTDGTTGGTTDGTSTTAASTSGANRYAGFAAVLIMTIAAALM